MAAAMLLPASGAISLLGAGLVTHTGPLMIVEHAAMLAGMVIAMLRRREEHTGHHHRQHQRVAT